MNPNRIFQKRILSDKTICNFCFRKKATRDESVNGEMYPDFAVPKYYPSADSDIFYPPDRTDKLGQVIPGSSSSEIFYSDIDENTDSFDWNDSNRVELSRPSIVCECGRIDDERINGSFPDDWENRPKEKLLDISCRVYHRLDEQGFNLDFDDFIDSVEKYKTSDDYDFGDYEVLQDAVADSVAVKQQEN